MPEDLANEIQTCNSVQYARTVQDTFREHCDELRDIEREPGHWCTAAPRRRLCERQGSEGDRVVLPVLCRASYALRISQRESSRNP